MYMYVYLESTFFWGWNGFDDNSREVGPFLLLLSHTPPESCIFIGGAAATVCGIH